VITGKTRVIGIVADPIGHVRTPQAFNALMAQRGCDAVMVPFHVKPDNFAPFFAALPAIENLVGLVVTLPYKEAIVPFCTHLSDAARRVGAVNVVKFSDGASSMNRTMTGNNFDGEGFAGGLAAQGHVINGQRVYIAGAGGAAKGISDALAERKVSAIGIYNRNRSRAEQLVDNLRKHYPQIDVHVAGVRPENYTLAVNATSLGLATDDPLPFSIDGLPTDAIVAEVVMSAEPTPLLLVAQQRGLVVHFGRHMLQVQLDRMADFLGLHGSRPAVDAGAT
jgi:shikimate dehydrogenase